MTNRFDQSLSRYEKIIKKAEALYPYYTFEIETESGNFLWYSDSKLKTPYNVTPRAVNYYFNLAADTKNSVTKYTVEVSEVLEVTQEKKDKLQMPYEEVYEVSLLLDFDFICGKLCGGGFERRKTVYFNQKEEITALYMPNLTERLY